MDNNIIDIIKEVKNEVTKSLFGGRDAIDVKRFINASEEHITRELEWHYSDFIKEATYANNRSQKHSKVIRNFYNEDPARCAIWFICGEQSPEYRVNINDFPKNLGN